MRHRTRRFTEYHRRFDLSKLTMESRAYERLEASETVSSCYKGDMYYATKNSC